MRAIHKNTESIVNIKYLKNLRTGPIKRMKNLLREVFIMHHLTHMPGNKYTVKLLDIIIPFSKIGTFENSETIDELFIIYECGDLNL